MNNLELEFLKNEIKSSEIESAIVYPLPGNSKYEVYANTLNTFSFFGDYLEKLPIDFYEVEIQTLAKLGRIGIFNKPILSKTVVCLYLFGIPGTQVNDDYPPHSLHMFVDGKEVATLNRIYKKEPRVNIFSMKENTVSRIIERIVSDALGKHAKTIMTLENARDKYRK